MRNEKSLGRELALQTLFQESFTQNVSDKELLKLLKQENPVPTKTLEFAQELVSGVLRNKENLDHTIQKTSPKWKVERMALVDLNLMRLATYEMLYQQLKPSIAINEAVELAKTYGTTDSSSFINALLDSIAKQMPS